MRSSQRCCPDGRLGCACIGHQICDQMLDHGVIVRAYGDPIVLTPPLVISDDDLGTIVQCLTDAPGDRA